MSKSKTSLHKLQTSTSLMSRNRPSTTMNHWVPNCDIYITENTLVVNVELAGISRDDLELSIDENRLFICGYRPDGCRAGKCTFLAMEINYGNFECVVDIPPEFDLSRAQAAYNNGFLRVDIPPVSASDTPPGTRSLEQD